MMNQVINRFAVYVIVGVSVILCLTYFIFNPAFFDIFPKCPFHELFGLDCPGCGSQRAFHSLLNGDVLKAVDYNLMFVTALPIWLFYYICQLVSLLTGKEIRLKMFRAVLNPKLIFSVVLVFWIVRNIPIKPFSYLAA
ncbi:MAG: rane protein [Daejeonella sp.]|nr:rane protein [Daejeonella sp.]